MVVWWLQITWHQICQALTSLHIHSRSRRQSLLKKAINTFTVTSWETFNQWYTYRLASTVVLKVFTIFALKLAKRRPFSASFYSTGDRMYRILWDQSHKSHNALDKYPTMHHFVTEMCTHVHISVINVALWDICLMYCGIWDSRIVGLWIWSTQRGGCVGEKRLDSNLHRNCPINMP